MFCPSGSVCEGLLQPRTNRRAHLPPDLLSLRQLLAGNHNLRHAAPQTDDDVHWTLDIVQVDGGDGEVAKLCQPDGDIEGLTTPGSDSLPSFSFGISILLVTGFNTG